MVEVVPCRYSSPLQPYMKFIFSAAHTEVQFIVRLQPLQQFNPNLLYKFSFMSDKYINDAMRLSNSIFSISVVFAKIYFLFVYLNLECKCRFVINFQSIGYLLNEGKILLKLFLQYETVHSIQKMIESQL